MRLPECRRDQAILSSLKTADVICPENECFVRISINPCKFLREMMEMSGQRITQRVRKTNMNRRTAELMGIAA